MKKIITLIFITILAAGILNSQTINITSPKSGKVWIKGKTYNITWRGNGYTP